MEFYHVPALPTSAKHADFSFEIASVVVAPFDATPLRTAPALSRWKCYDIDDELFQPCDNVDSARFVAAQSGQLAGYIALSRDWNGCAQINDIAVARSFRRRGVATALMDKAVDWTLKSDLRTIRLETQSTNVTACRFYLRDGFVLGGYDRFLYSNLGPDISQEVALFWYLNVRYGRKRAD